ncbi:MAG TPA: HAD-IC family P-type ATPase, partial [Aggregatilineales bacterium]|nr:HAD-IC family P-type ATPase [Aggregatilineales bacterium]
MIDSHNIRQLKITGMDCADCAKTLEKGVGQLEGVQACEVNFMNGSMRIEGSADVDSITSRIQALGYGVASEDSAGETSASFQENRGGMQGFVRFMMRRRKTALALLSLAALILSFALILLNAPDLLIKVSQLAIVLVAGLPIIRSGIRQFIFTRDVTINLLMSIATVGAIAIGEWSEAATVIVLFAIGEALEGYTTDRARSALQSLLLLAPRETLVIRPCMDCAEHMGQDGYTGGACPWCEPHEQMIAAETIEIGETMVIRPGDRIALDGIVISGSSAVDQSPITGESIPVDKHESEPVFAGSINGSGVLHAEVTSLAQDSTLNRIIRMVEDAQAKKAPSERFVDRFAQVYTPLVVILAVLVVTIPTLIFGGAFDTWLYRALALLVVACPCALVISTPVTVVSAMVRAAQH